MKAELKININNKSKTNLLLAPLDWGFGHTTRCIPIIKHLLDREYEVTFAGTAAQTSLIRKHFPNLQTTFLPGYALTYGPSRKLTILALIFQIPRILMAIKKEKDWLSSYLSNHPVSVVISDSRFGLTNSNTHTIFITHQLYINTPFGKAIGRRLQKWNYFFIEKFNSCWVADFQNYPCLAGDLSHPSKLPSLPVHYLGGLTRFHKQPKTESLDLLVIVSGPEPQRSLFEKKMRKALNNFKGSFKIADGSMTSDELNAHINNAELVISRTGYTTVMDLLALGKKSILIPTPGQSEQEYLAKFLTENKLALCLRENDFELNKALEASAHFDYANLQSCNFMLFQNVIDQYLIDHHLV